MKNLGIYVHIPFCKKKCDYCDFISFANKEECEGKYVEALCKDIINEKAKASNYEVNTVYFGGGTPSYINENSIGKVLKTIKYNYNLCEDEEVTIEVNPRNCY